MKMSCPSSNELTKSDPARERIDVDFLRPGSELSLAATSGACEPSASLADASMSSRDLVMDWGEREPSARAFISSRVSPSRPSATTSGLAASNVRTVKFLMSLPARTSGCSPRR